MLKAVLFQLKFYGAHVIQLLHNERFVAGYLELQGGIVQNDDQVTRF